MAKKSGITADMAATLTKAKELYRAFEPAKPGATLPVPPPVIRPK